MYNVRLMCTAAESPFSNGICEIRLLKIAIVMLRLHCPGL